MNNFVSLNFIQRMMPHLDVEEAPISLLEMGKSGIKIKKKNRGKFTEYCGGKVTDECIQRGKNSSDPKIRKRATFAKNVRAWKHQYGGSLQLIALDQMPFDLSKYFVSYNALDSNSYYDKINKLRTNLNSDIEYIPKLTSSKSNNSVSEQIKDNTPVSDLMSKITGYSLSSYINSKQPEIKPEVKSEIKPEVKLKVKSNNPGKYSDKKLFINDLTQAYKRLGLNDDLIKLLVALSGGESGWGRSPIGHYNYGNIHATNKQGKRVGGWTGNIVWGIDHDANGNKYNVGYRSYVDIDDFARNKWALLSGKRYGLTKDMSAEEAIDRIVNGGYAEAKNYRSALRSWYKSVK